MKVKWGMMMTDGRGKLGGQVASKNRSGAYVRTKVTPVNPQTSFQSAIRSRLASLSSAWRGLTPAQIAGWNALAETQLKTDIFGDGRVPTGKNLFTGLNINKMGVGGSQLNDAPNSLPPSGSVVNANVEWSVTDNQLMLNGLLNFPANRLGTYRLVIESTPFVSNGKNFVKNLYRTIGSVPITIGAGGDVILTDIDLTSLFTARFGPLNASFNGLFQLFFRVKIVSVQYGPASVPFSMVADAVVD